MKNTFEKAMMIPYTFVLMNWAPIAGLYHLVRGRRLGIWNPVAVKRA